MIASEFKVDNILPVYSYRIKQFKVEFKINEKYFKKESELVKEHVFLKIASLSEKSLIYALIT